ncbi:MAG: methionine--tRNA ligase [Candidatus Heimdallarchaeota archaeon]|nr:methionine--tRNA ligase [Candidatus Heimdallarchaeota archaeon]
MLSKEKLSKDKEKWVITAAWPYVNTVPHLGTMLHLLSGDVITRYHKLRGHKVVYVSGSDAHGTPIVVAAEQEGILPEKLARKYHQKVLQLLEQWNIDFDKYTITNNPIHISFVQNFHKKIYENGFFNLQTSEQYYCQQCQRFLPDRFVEGTCPKCGIKGARGDQCSNHKCEVILKPSDLLDPYCSTCEATPVIKETKHWYFNLPAFENELQQFLEENVIIPNFAKQKALSMIDEGLIERPISRDLSWGISIDPIFGEEFANKVLYVWFENVLGYVSTVKLLAEEQGQPEKFQDFWFDKKTRTVFCLGKDNIIFHALLFPALLLATKDPYPLPQGLAVTNFLMFKEGPFSKSKGIGIWGDEAVAILPADCWRYYLLANRPELKDVYFDWDEFVKAINTDLNDVIGNFVNRILSFITKNFDEKIPPRGEPNSEDKELIRSVEEAINGYIDAMDNLQLKAATNIVTAIARQGNQYFSSTEPWHKIKSDKEKVGTILNLSITIVRVLATLLWPIIPSVAEKLWNALGFDERIEDNKLPVIISHDSMKNQLIKKIPPLFNKISAKNVQKKLKQVRNGL